MAEAQTIGMGALNGDVAGTDLVSQSIHQRSAGGAVAG